MAAKHYIYIYLNPMKNGSFEYSEECCFPNEPFYVGLGSGSRYLAHLRNSNLNNDPNKHKVNTIKKILKNNKSPIIKKIYVDLTFKEACSLEKQIIKIIGRKDLKLGPLTNLSDGGEGYTGPKTKEHKEKLSKARIGKKVILSKESIKRRSESRKKNHKGYDYEMRAKLSKTRIERQVAVGKNNPAFRHDIDNKEIKNLYDSGLSCRKIAKLFNTSHHTISGRLKCI